jgi:hypothetical protein
MNPKSKPAVSAPFASTRQAISRRRFLRGTGIALSLPFLDSMIAPFARTAQSQSALAPGAAPRRLFAICNNLGLLPLVLLPMC